MRAHFTGLFVILTATSALSRLVACEAPPRIETWQVAPYEVACGDASEPRTCLELTSPDGDVLALEQGVEGYTWQWGVGATLAVRVEERASRPPRLVLERVIAEHPVDPERDRFTLELGAPWLERTTEGGFRLVHSRGIDCQTLEQCSALDDALDSDDPRLLTVGLRYPRSPGGPLIVEHLGDSTSARVAPAEEGPLDAP